MDYIKGEVTEIIDGESFTMSVDYLNQHNRKEYDGFEKIRIVKIDPPLLKNISRENWKSRLEKKLLGKRVYSHIQGKNKEGYYKARVELDDVAYRGKSKTL